MDQSVNVSEGVEPHARRFVLRRSEDVSGVSGTGDVADGVEFPDGKAVVRWRSTAGSTVVWDDISHAEHVHGHGGLTKIVYLDA